MQKLKTLSDPIFNDFLYTILFNLTAAQKRQLGGKYLKASMSERAAKTFIKSATDDEKKYLLTLCGFRFFWALFREDLNGSKLREVLDKYDKDEKPKALKDVMEYGLYVESDTNFMKLLGYVSRTIHHHAYFKNMEMAKVGFQIKRWKKRAFLPGDLEMRNISDGATEMAKMLLSGTIIVDYIKAILGISPAQMKILLYLYTCQHRHTSEDFLFEFFYSYIRQAEIKKSLIDLRNEGYIDVERGENSKMYTIAAKGIGVVNEFFKNVFSKLNY